MGVAGARLSLPTIPSPEAESGVLHRLGRLFPLNCGWCL